MMRITMLEFFGGDCGVGSKSDYVLKEEGSSLYTRDGGSFYLEISHIDRTLMHFNF